MRNYFQDYRRWRFLKVVDRVKRHSLKSRGRGKRKPTYRKPSTKKGKALGEPPEGMRLEEEIVSAPGT